MKQLVQTKADISHLLQIDSRLRKVVYMYRYCVELELPEKFYLVEWCSGKEEELGENPEQTSSQEEENITEMSIAIFADLSITIYQ